MAASAAIRFAKVAFVERDYENARRLLPPEVDRQFGPKELKNMIEEMHPRYFPSIVTATEYEPVLETKFINIFLVGENTSEGNNNRIYYRLVLGGSPTEGYKVYEMYSRLTPYETSRLRSPLPFKRSTND